MIKQTVNRSAFHDAFNAVRPDNFNYAGLNALYDYLEQLSDDMGQDIELDVIAICCDFSQYPDLERLLAATLFETIEEVHNETIVLECDDGSYIIQDY